MFDMACFSLNDFEKKVFDSLCGCLGFSDVDFEKKLRVGVGVSGGADSVCLLVCLAKIFMCVNKSLDAGKKVFLNVVSVNHNIRSEEESAGDCNFVVSVCKKLNDLYKKSGEIKDDFILCDVVSLEKGKVCYFAKDRGFGVEEAARFLRYEIFDEFILKNDLDCFCLAHNKNDQLETALMRFLQGSSIEGNCGIWERRGKFVRPLIVCERAEIENYLLDQGFEWRTDCTNFENVYFRNRVRNELIPFLDEKFVGWKSSVLGGIKKNRLDFEIIEDCLKKVPFVFDKDKNEISVLLSDFFAIKDGMKIRFLFECCNLIGENDRLSFSFFEDVVLSLKRVFEKVGEKKDVKICNENGINSFEKCAAGVVIICKNGKLFVKKYTKKQTDLLFFDIIEEDGEYFFNGKSLVVEGKKLIFGETMLENICFPLCIRNVQIGDVVECADGKMKKVFDVFSDWHVSEIDKEKILIVQELCSECQNVIGILGKEFGYFDWIVKDSNFVGLKNE